jgi:hypothetical protein
VKRELKGGGIPTEFVISCQASLPVSEMDSLVEEEEKKKRWPSYY